MKQAPWRLLVLALVASVSVSRARPSYAAQHAASRGAQAAPGAGEFGRHCASCHGDYRAPGCAAREAPALTRARPRPFSEALTRRVVRRGIPRARAGCSMPAYDTATLPDADLTAIIAWLRLERSVR